MNRAHQPCCHLTADHCTLQDVKRFDESNKCSNCPYAGPNLWICLYKKCMLIGCSEQAGDHSTEHYERSRDKALHCIQMDLTTHRSWCYLCEREIAIGGVERPAQMTDPVVRPMRSSDEENDSDYTSASGRGTGLVGLQNIANTCYMNSALQALSNVIPMTHYFLSCGDLVDHTLEQSAHRCKAGLAKSYQRLMRDIWRKREEGKPFVAPRSILYGIRSVHPMFRGFQQHDTQEFLRCFMDQLHEELKETVINSDKSKRVYAEEHSKQEEDDVSSEISACSSETLDTNYVTCESSNSEPSSLGENYVGVKATRSTSGTSPISNFTTTSSAAVSASSIRSIVSDIFDGKLLSSVQCLTCNRVSTREETFQDLSLPIPNRDFLTVLHQANSMSVQSLNSIDSTSSTTRANEGWLSWFWNIVRSWLWGPSVNLHDCMASFFSADELKGDNMYSCEKCNKLRTGVKFSRVLDLPEVLCIHLKRFRHDLSYSSKISSHVEFPLENFDMRPYLHKDCKSQVAMYQLTSVICHHGTVGGGHYTCFARNAYTDRWYEYDDHHVNEVSADTVQNCQAYVLFYQKSNPQMELFRFEANELASSYPASKSDIRFFISREWLARFNTFSEPGPISNWSMLCPHGDVLYTKMPVISQLAVPISQQSWEFLYRKFGGGPAINLLFECEICKRAAEALALRQHYEHSIFQRYNGLDAELDSGAIYAVSMSWLRKWQQFAKGLTHKEPGPINNVNIVSSIKDTAPKNSPVRNVRVGSDYIQLNAPLWRFLLDIYGGGPEVLLRPSLTEEIVIIDQDELDDDTTMGNVSDTESNMGSHSYNVTECPSPNEDSVINEQEESDDENPAGFNTGNKSQKRKDRQSIKKFNKALAATLSKKGKHKDNKDLFGVQGNYQAKDSELHSQDENEHNDQQQKQHTEKPNEMQQNAFSSKHKSHSLTKSRKYSFRNEKRFRKYSAPMEVTSNENSSSVNVRSHRGGKRGKTKNTVVLKNFQSLSQENSLHTGAASDSNETDV